MARITTGMDVSFLRAVEPTTIPARMVYPVKVALEGPKSQHLKDKPLFIESDDGAFELNGMVVQVGTATPDSGSIGIWVINPHSHDCELQRGAIVGRASVADQVYKMPDRRSLVPLLRIVLISQYILKRPLQPSDPLMGRHMIVQGLALLTSA